MPAWLVSLLPGALGRIFDFAEGWQERRKKEVDAKHELRLARENTTESLQFIAGLPPWISGGFLTISLAIYGLDKMIRIKK